MIPAGHHSTKLLPSGAPRYDMNASKWQSDLSTTRQCAASGDDLDCALKLVLSRMPTLLRAFTCTGLLLVLALSAHAANATGAATYEVAAGAAPRLGSQRFSGRDLFDLQQVADPQISPDGKTIVYVRMSFDIMTDRAGSELWQVDVDSTTQTPLATGLGTYSSPRWSPDGTRLVYVSTADGRGPQLFVRWMKSGIAARITDLTNEPSDPAWSADGRSIAFVMKVPEGPPRLGTALEKPAGASWAEPLALITDVSYRADGEGMLVPGYSHVFVVPADGGATRQLTSGSFNDRGPLSWTADGGFILFSSNRHTNWPLEALASQIHRVSVTDGSQVTLVNRDGPFHAPKVAPDGAHIAYLGFDDRLLMYANTRLYVMERDGGHPRSLTDDLDRSIDDMVWAADGRSLYVRYVDRAVIKVARVDLNGHVVPVVAGLAGSDLDRPYLIDGSFSVSMNGTVAYAGGGATRPADLMVERNGRIQQLTRLNDALLSNRTLGKIQSLAVTSAYDHRPIDAWMVLPPDIVPGQKCPLILEIHGGPGANYGLAFSTDDQLYAAAGYVVVYSNPRGSTSYGEEFGNLIHHDYPGHDYDDLMSVVDAAVGTGFVNPDRLYVTGGSGGGILTSWIVGRTQRFTAAAVQKPAVNMASFALTTDSVNEVYKYWFAAPPWDDPQAYWLRSPLSGVGRVTTPTLLVVGDQDLRAPVSEAEQFYAALKLRGIPTALLEVPGASHEGLASRPSQSAARVSAILDWFQRYSGKALRETTPPGTPDVLFEQSRLPEVHFK